MENHDSVDQNLAPKFRAIRHLVLTHPDIFLRRGSVVATMRTYHGHRLGPFYSLRFRVEGKQKAVYLGRSPVLATQVTCLLTDLRKGVQEQRMLARLKCHARAQLRRCKEKWERDLAAVGLRLKGFEIRGQRSSCSATTSVLSKET